MALNEVSRAYLIDDHDRVRRFPWPRYVRILKGRERVPLFSQKTIRFAESVFGVDNGVIVYALAHFPLIAFDIHGVRDKAQQLAEQQLALQESRCAEDSEWRTLYFAERMATLRWEPSEAVLKQLEKHVPQVGGRDHVPLF